MYIRASQIRDHNKISLFDISVFMPEGFSLNVVGMVMVVYECIVEKKENQHDKNYMVQR